MTMTDSLENMYIGITTIIKCITCLIASSYWLLTSYIEYSSECIKELDKRVKKLEQTAVTRTDDKIEEDNK